MNTAPADGTVVIGKCKDCEIEILFTNNHWVHPYGRINGMIGLVLSEEYQPSGWRKLDDA